MADSVTEVVYGIPIAVSTPVFAADERTKDGRVVSGVEQSGMPAKVMVARIESGERRLNLIGSFVIAFSMYSRIPMPRMDWTEERMRYALCFFPLIGAVIGAVRDSHVCAL